MTSTLTIGAATSDAVVEDLARLNHGQKMAPVVLPAADVDADHPLVVADGCDRTGVGDDVNDWLDGEP